MNKYKGFTTFLALVFIALPAVSFADGTYYYGSTGLNEVPPVRTVGTVISQNPATATDTNTTVINPVAYNGNILGIHIKTKAERDAEKAEENAAKARADEEARLARNNDGTFAYGYTNGSGAQYTSGARYVDARETNNTRRYTASAGSAISSNGFLPHTFGGWVIAIILLAILIAIVRAFKERFYTRQRLVYVQ